MPILVNEHEEGYALAQQQGGLYCQMLGVQLKQGEDPKIILRRPKLYGWADLIRDFPALVSKDREVVKACPLGMIQLAQCTEEQTPSMTPDEAATKHYGVHAFDEEMETEMNGILVGRQRRLFVMRVVTLRREMYLYRRAHDGSWVKDPDPNPGPPQIAVRPMRGLGSGRPS